MMLRFVPVVLFALLSACASNPDANTAESKAGLPSLNSQTRISVEWRRSLGEGSINQYTRLRPAVSGNAVFAADPNGEVYRLDLADGDTQWRTQIESGVLGGVAMDGEQVFVSSRHGFLYALNSQSGELLWKSRLTSEAIAPAGMDDRRVFVHTVDGRVTAFERSTGQQAWSYESGMPVLTVRGTGAPLVLDQWVMVGLASGKLVALDKTLGIPRWEARLATPDGRSELERLVDVDGTPVFQDGLIYAASYHGKVMAVGLNGEVRWQEDGSSYTSPELALGSLFLTLDNDVIQAYEQTNGAKIWQQPALIGRTLGQVTAHGRWLAVTDAEGYLHLLSQVSGELVGRRWLQPRPLHVTYPNQAESTNWRALRGKNMGIRSPLISTREGLLVYTNSGELMLLKIRDR